MSQTLQDRPTCARLFSGSLSELLHPPANQIPFLDGLRSIAVLLVISAHLSGRFVVAHGSNLFAKLPFVENGWIGVDLFFVLSGFFIGGQLWKELRSRRSIHVGRFIMRRGFRIWPLYFFTFLCVFVFALILGHASAKEYGWTDLVFITNFHNRGLVAGSWSLCTEEQFYIVTPLVLSVFAGCLPLIRNCRPWLWGLLFSVPLLRCAIWIHETGHFFQHNPKVFTPIYYSSLTHCDGLIIGLIIANFWVTGEKPDSKVTNPGVLASFAFILAIALHQLQKEIFDFTGLALLFCSLVWLGLQYHPPVFNSRLFYWLSRLSFGMYLNHEYMCPWIVNHVLLRIGLSAKFSILLNVIGVLLITLISAAIALVTFCFVEYPFLQMRKTVLEGNR